MVRYLMAIISSVKSTCCVTRLFSDSCKCLSDNLYRNSNQNPVSKFSYFVVDVPDFFKFPFAPVTSFAHALTHVLSKLL